MYRTNPASRHDRRVTPLRLMLFSTLLTLVGVVSFSAAQPSIAESVSTDVQTVLPSSPFPLQLEIRTPFPPTAFSSDGQTHLVYELYLTNYSSSELTLRSIDVLDARISSRSPLETFDGNKLINILRNFGHQSSGATPTQIGPGTTVVAFMWISFDRAVKVPDYIGHRINTSEASVDSPAIYTHHTKIHVLSGPVRGGGWTTYDGPNNDQSNHHRRGNLVVNGQMVMSRRYAIDWMRYRNGKSVAYGEPVFAVANATVVSVRDGLPDNKPAPVETFQPAIPITLETAGGNTIVLDLGDGQYAWYVHLRPGSILVKPGELVRRGDRLAQIGLSGDSNVPHLHFEVSNSTALLAGEGLPYVFDHYRSLTQDRRWQLHSSELPLGGMLIDFGESGKENIPSP